MPPASTSATSGRVALVAATISVAGVVMLIARAAPVSWICEGTGFVLGLAVLCWASRDVPTRARVLGLVAASIPLAFAWLIAHALKNLR